MKAIELFAGAGGLGIGLSQAGFIPVQIVERDRWCCDTLRLNTDSGVAPVVSWPAPSQMDIRDIDFQGFADRVSLVSGGPPCQPFSLGGRHRAHADERDMWSEAVRVIREVRPPAFIFENVKGLTRAAFATYLQYIERQLENPTIARRPDETWGDHLSRLERHHTSGSAGDLSYRVVYQVLNAANYGVPQRRERVVFVGLRSDLNIGWAFPEPTHSRDALLWDMVRTEDYWERHRVSKSERTVDVVDHNRAIAIAGRPSAKAWLTVRDALSGLPDPELEPHSSPNFYNHGFQAGARSYKGHTGSPLDGPAKTLKAGVHGVPGGENMLVRQDGSVRYFSVREAARLQGFPDDYRFRGAWSEAMRQLGNAVPTTLARVIGARLIDQLRREKPKNWLPTIH